MDADPNVSRRQFMGRGTLAASVLLLGRAAASAAVHPDQIRCGMNGIGGRGYQVLKAIHKVPGVQVTALCDIDAILEVAATSEGIFQVGTQLRYASRWQPAIETVLGGQLGQPIMIRAYRHHVGDYPCDRRWLFYRRYSGDTILEQAVHEFDLFNRVLGGIPVRASGFGGLGLWLEPDDRDTLDHYTLSLDYSDGV